MTTEQRDPRVDAVQDALDGRSEDLALALTELAAVLVDDEPLPALRQRVADLAAAVVPGCDGAGVTLVERDRPTTAAWTDDLVRAVSDQLQAAPDSRTVIEQAKGVLVARHGLSADEAFDRLRRWSQEGNRELRDVAAEVLAGVPRQRDRGRAGPEVRHDGRTG